MSFANAPGAKRALSSAVEVPKEVVKEVTEEDEYEYYEEEEEEEVKEDDTWNFETDLLHLRILLCSEAEL